MHALHTEGSPRYRPRAASNPLKEIVEDSLEDLLRLWDARFLKDHGPLHPRVRDLMDAFVRCSRRLDSEDRQGLESLLEYMARAPVALERLEYRSDGLVHYRGNYHPGLQRDHQLLPAIDFLALLVPHVLLRYEVSIRSYGALSTTIRKRFGWIKKDSSSPVQVTVVENESEFLRVRRRSWARLIARVWCENPALCPTCGKEMKILAAITSPAQDEVIEKVLRARGEWAPPWLAARQARGPPVSEGIYPSTEAAWIDPPATDDGHVDDFSGED